MTTTTARADGTASRCGPAASHQHLAVEPGQQPVRQLLGRTAAGLRPGQLGEVGRVDQLPAPETSAGEPELADLRQVAGGHPQVPVAEGDAVGVAQPRDVLDAERPEQFPAGDVVDRLAEEPLQRGGDQVAAGVVVREGRPRRTALRRCGDVGDLAAGQRGDLVDVPRSPVSAPRVMESRCRQVCGCAAVQRSSLGTSDTGSSSPGSRPWAATTPATVDSTLLVTEKTSPASGPRRSSSTTTRPPTRACSALVCR